MIPMSLSSLIIVALVGIIIGMILGISLSRPGSR